MAAPSLKSQGAILASMPPARHSPIKKTGRMAGFLSAVNNGLILIRASVN